MLKNILKTHFVYKDNIVDGEGCYFIDEKGKKYLDMESGIWCLGLGYKNKELNDTIKNQIDKIVHTHTYLQNKEVDKPAQKLLEINKFKNGKVVFLSSGSEAVELATKIARKKFPNKKLLTFNTSFLGSYTNENDLIRLDINKCFSCEKNECAKCAKINKMEFDNIKTFILEPGSTLGTFRNIPKKLIKEIAIKIRNNKGIIISNEVTSGNCRSGKWYAYMHYDIKPDMVATGKCLGNGYPVSATIINEEISNYIEQTDFQYKQSHQNDPLGAVVANKVLEIMIREKLDKKSETLGKYFIEKLSNLDKKYNFLKKVNGRGLMKTFFLNSNYNSFELFNFMYKEGVFIGFSKELNFIRIYPPLIIEEHQIDYFFDTLEKYLKMKVKKWNWLEEK